jgi:hypothetical protein
MSNWSKSFFSTFYTSSTVNDDELIVKIADFTSQQQKTNRGMSELSDVVRS